MIKIARGYGDYPDICTCEMGVGHEFDYTRTDDINQIYATVQKYNDKRDGACECRVEVKEL